MSHFRAVDFVRRERFQTVDIVMNQNESDRECSSKGYGFPFIWVGVRSKFVVQDDNFTSGMGDFHLEINFESFS